MFLDGLFKFTISSKESRRESGRKNKFSDSGNVRKMDDESPRGPFSTPYDSRLRTSQDVGESDPRPEATFFFPL